MVDFEIVDIRKYNNEMIEEALNNMSDFRKEKYLSYKNEISKRESLVASALLDKIIKKYGYREKNAEYVLGKYEKPYFSNIKNLYFSISHSKNIAMVCVSDKEIGCDVEKVNFIEEGVYNLVLSDSEKIKISNIKDKILRNEEFMKYWVVKEALVKKTGEGITKIKKTLATQERIKNVKEYILNDINEKYYYYIECE